MGKSELGLNMQYRVCLIADNHFVKGLNGDYYVNGTYTEQYLRRFTSNFDEVVVVARGRQALNEDEVSNLRLSGGERVSFCLLPDFYGVKNFILLKKSIKSQLQNVFRNVDAVFVRMPCILTTVSIKCAAALGKPIMLDVGADPATIYLSTKPTFLEKMLSFYMGRMCRKTCLKANGVSYVTDHVLQEKYPCMAMIKGESKKYFTASISNADISSEVYLLRKYSNLNRKLKLLHISNNICNKSGKGHEETILVLACLIKKKIDAFLTFVGDGEGVESLKKFAELHGVSDRISFTGRIASRDEYFRIIKMHDVFVFPSHSEGLPRVLLEVMATGMLCVASNVDGIPEILDREDIFRFNDIDGFCRRIVDYVENYELVLKQSTRNYTVSQKYSDANLKNKYNEYYSKVRNLIDDRKQ